MHVNYKVEAYCSFCGEKREYDDCVEDVRGTLRCPACRRPVRTRPYKGTGKAERHYIEVEP